MCNTIQLPSEIIWYSFKKHISYQSLYSRHMKEDCHFYSIHTVYDICETSLYDVTWSWPFSQSWIYMIWGFNIHLHSLDQSLNIVHTPFRMTYINDRNLPRVTYLIYRLDIKKKIWIHEYFCGIVMSDSESVLWKRDLWNQRV